MSKTCGECTYLNINPGKGDLYGKFPCEKLGALPKSL